MSAEAFIDTSIFIYQLEAAVSRKAAVADQIIGEAVATGSGCISFQVYLPRGDNSRSVRRRHQ